MTLRAEGISRAEAKLALCQNGPCARLSIYESDARIASAIVGVDLRSVRISGERRAYFARLELMDDALAMDMLAQGMIDYARSQGMQSIFGPVALDGSGFEVGVKMSGFEWGKELLNPDNPRYYDALLRGAGFSLETTWRAYLLDVAPIFKRRYIEAADWACARYDIRIDALSPLTRRADCEALYRAMGIADQLSLGEFAVQLERLKPHIGRGLTMVAVRDHEPCGMLMALVDRRTNDVRLSTVHIREAQRGRATLISLMGAMAKALQGRKIGRLTASVIDSENAPSIAVVEGAGGRLIGEYGQYALHF